MGEPNEQSDKNIVIYNPGDYVPGFITKGQSRWLDVPTKEIQKKFWEEVTKLAIKYQVTAINAEIIKRW